MASRPAGPEQVLAALLPALLAELTDELPGGHRPLVRPHVVPMRRSTAPSIVPAAEQRQPWCSMAAATAAAARSCNSAAATAAATMGLAFHAHAHAHVQPAHQSSTGHHNLLQHQQQQKEQQEAATPSHRPRDVPSLARLAACNTRVGRMVKMLTSSAPAALATEGATGDHQLAYSQSLRLPRAEGWGASGSWALAQSTAHTWALSARLAAASSPVPEHDDGSYQPGSAAGTSARGEGSSPQAETGSHSTCQQDAELTPHSQTSTATGSDSAASCHGASDADADGAKSEAGREEAAGPCAAGPGFGTGHGEGQAAGEAEAPSSRGAAAYTPTAESQGLRWFSALGEDTFLEDAIMQELEMVLREKARLAEENRRLKSENQSLQDLLVLQEEMNHQYETDEDEGLETLEQRRDQDKQEVQDKVAAAGSLTPVSVLMPPTGL